jgi:hypothetical protein
MIIHIFTGSKGGIGKTRCSISTAMYYLLGGVKKPVLKMISKNNKKKQKINVYDANSNNIDFFTIMTGKDFDILNQDQDKDYIIDDYIKHEFLKISHNHKLLPTYGYAYIRKSPFELFKGVSDFWNSVYEVAKITKEKDNTEVLIVDTNLAVPNLVSEDIEQKEKMKNVFPKFRKLDIDHILIWYIWCLNDFLSIRENLTFSTSKKIELLEKICQGEKNPGETRNGIRDYVIHVLNPYLFFKTSPKFKAFLNKLFSNKAFKTIIDNIQIGFNIPFDVAVRILVQIINEIIIEDDSPTPWQEAMKKIKEINDTGLNIVVLEDQKQNHPYIKEQLINISSEELMKLEMMHKNNFGENTLWKKLNEFHQWVRI